MQKTFVISCMALIAMLLFATSCSNFKKQSDEGAIRACIVKMIKAMQDKNKDAFLKTCLPTYSQEEKKEIEDWLHRQFENFDISITIDSYKLISKEDDNATVEVVMTAKKTDDNELLGQSTIKFDLKKIDAKWYVVDPRGSRF